MATLVEKPRKKPRIPELFQMIIDHQTLMETVFTGSIVDFKLSKKLFKRRATLRADADRWFSPPAFEDSWGA